MKFRASSLRAAVSLGSGDDTLRCSIRADWHEIGNEERDVQLQFYAPFGYAPVCYRCDEAAGVIDRAALGHDVPALTYAAAVPEEGRGIMVTSDVMRLGNLEGAEASAAVSLGGCASFADVCENVCETVSVGEKHTLNIPAKALRTVKIN